MRRVVIVGMGFGGVRAARALAGKGVEMLLIDRHNYHLFQPLLYQVATAGLDPESIAYPIRAMIRGWPNARYLMATVHRVDLEHREVYTDRGPLAYDELVLACGSAAHYYGLEEAKRQAFVLKHLDDAIALRNHILAMFEQAACEPDPEALAALLTFVLVGAGPTGIELCGSLAELISRTLVKDYPHLDMRKARVLLVEAQGHVLPSLPASLQRYAQRRLRRLNVEILLGQPVTAVQPGQVTLRDGTAIRTHTLIWTAGVRAASLADTLPGSKGPGGRVRVRPDLTLDGYPNVYVIGDMAYLEQDGQPLPMLAPVAMQQGEYVAKAIARRARGLAVPPFRYRDKGTMAIIGRYAAVAHAFGVNLKGFPAWVAWLVLHLYYLVGFRNRVIALLNWVYAYLLVDPKVRLITRSSPDATQESCPNHQLRRERG